MRRLISSPRLMTDMMIMTSTSMTRPYQPACRTVCMASSFFVANEYQEIDSIANELERVNGSRRITPEFEFDDSSHRHLLRFEAFDEMFALLLSRKPDTTFRPRETETTPPTQTTLPSVANVSTTPPPLEECYRSPVLVNLERDSFFKGRVDGRTLYPLACQRVCRCLVPLAPEVVEFDRLVP